MKSKILFAVIFFIAILFSHSVLSQSVLNDDFYNNIQAGSFMGSGDLNSHTKLVQTSPNAPNSFYLGQVFPNHSASENEFYLSVPAGQHVKVMLLNMFGQQLDAIVDQVMEEGTYKISYDVSGLTSGVYMCSLQTENYSELKKMLLVK